MLFIWIILMPTITPLIKMKIPCVNGAEYRMRNYQLHPSQFCVGKAYKVSSKNFLWHQVEFKRKKKRNKREKKLVWENFRDDAFWGILAKKKKKPLQCSKCLTVELTTFYISDTSFALLDIKISIERQQSAVVFTTNLQIHIVTCCIHRRIHH